MAKHIHIFLGGKQPRITTSDSGDWEESKHKRDADGKFGSGGGGGAKPAPKTTPAKPSPTEPVTMKETENHPFVEKLIRAHPSQAAMKQAIAKNDDATLTKGLAALKAHPHQGASQKMVKELFEAELKSRGATAHAEGQEQVRKQAEGHEQAMPKGSTVKLPGGQGSAQVIGHSGNMVKTTKGDFHATKVQPASTSAATARAANAGHAAETAAAYKALESHPMYSKEDFAYLKGKGYEPDEIKAFWDRDQKAGKRPQLGNKQSPMSKAEMNLLRHAMGGKPYEPPKK